MNTIKVKKYSHVLEEYVAAGTITPGFLLEFTSAGEVQAHSNAGQNMLPLFAVEDELQGRGINDDYTADEQVQTWVPYRGDFVYALLKDGEDVAIGDLLESAGDGTLQKHIPDTVSSAGELTSYTNQIVGQALEAVDLTATANTAAGRIKVRIL
ncbi:MAG: hypothetical protein B6I31_05540 [Desulfobacteraceae bacterium 4572_19]|nr:MAG: hypothetical protein B6I31_05540 [Desulfobacteraceae bacterium 4572_19]